MKKFRKVLIIIIILFYLGVPAFAIDEDYEELETRELSFSCNCSRERCYRVLGTLPKEDLLAMIEEDHGCDMHCEYCSSTYHFEEKEDQLIKQEKARCESNAL